MLAVTIVLLSSVVPEKAEKRNRGAGMMSRRTAARLAWMLCALSLALTALSLLHLVLSLSHLNTYIYIPWLDNTLTAISYAPVGALIASRHPANPVGWLLCLFGLAISLSYFGAEYANL
jgi:di/tricarboxylate transporter